MNAAISYTESRGTNLLRTRNINAPLDDGSRPDPSRGPILQFESTGRSKRQEAAASLQGELSGHATFYLRYANVRAFSDTGNAYTEPANSYDLTSEYGPADDESKHQFYGETYLWLPHGWTVSPNIYIASPAPFNITTGFDNNNDNLFTDRPAFGDPNDPGSITTRFGTFNPNPGAGDTIIPRNYGRGSTQVYFNLSIIKSFTFGRISPSVRADVYNVFNRKNLMDYEGVVTSPTFGQPHSAGDARRVFLGATVSF
jgi:hypothetical protein